MESQVTVKISRSDLKRLSPPIRASITNVKPLSSYNWIGRPTATIVIPGSPPVWSAPKGSRQLSKDSGQVYIDQNGARYPDHPLEPLFRALYATHPSFDINSVDIVTDRNNIRKLLTFINSGLTTNGPEPFSIGVVTIGETTILCREEAATTRYIGPLEFKGFGHEFEKSYTTSQIQDSTGHHRIISYQFGGLNFVVRYEADGYVAENSSLVLPDSKGTDQLINSLSALSLSPTKPTPGHTMDVPVNSKLAVEQQGRIVPHESILEIKTRTSSKPLTIQEIGPQLWISQTTKLVRAYHNRGTFPQPYLEDFEAHIKKWEESNQCELRELSALIKEIIRVVRECGGSATIKYDGQERLTVHKADRKEILPSDLYSKWDNSGVAEVVDHQATGGPGTRLGEPTEARAASGLSEATGARPKNYGDGPYSKVIGYAIDKGFRQFFRRMPTQLSQYHVLCDNLDALAIDVTEGRTVRGIMEDMRKGKSNWDPEERHTIGGLKNVARDAAFRLLYMIMQSKINDSNMAYNATLFVVSHRGIFKSRTRNMVLQAFTERFNISLKQRAALEKWPVGYFGGETSEDDVTTANEDDFYFDSDYSL